MKRADTDVAELAELLDGACVVARQAGAVVMDIYQNQAYETYAKDDESPVTSADYAANQVIIDGLTALDKTIPILSEEGSHLSLDERQQWSRYWLIDPIDGTQEFIAGSGDFGIVIALVEQSQPGQHQPVLGVIYWPATATLYCAQRGQGAVKISAAGTERLQVRQFSQPEQEAITIAMSRRQPPARVLQRMSAARSYTTVATGSCSLKACLVAEGSADCFLRVGPTGEWDTAAAEVIVGEAGGRIVDEYFQPLSYNCETSLGNPNFIVLGDAKVPWQQVFTHHLG
ncbi:MAG: 3'(2'),5'-bisphosphate nucleotidase CysQ [Pseudidiomarina maritima]|nr:3'(2'),5'-bisphosphate nucleotidase CysQ [Pseudidiomarina maritima]